MRDSLWTTSVRMFDGVSLTLLTATSAYMVATCIMSLSHLHEHLNTFYLSQLETEDGRRNAKEKGTRLLTLDEQANVQHAYNMNIAGAILGLVLLCACIASQGTLLFKYFSRLEEFEAGQRYTPMADGFADEAYLKAPLEYAQVRR